MVERLRRMIIVAPSSEAFVELSSRPSRVRCGGDDRRRGRNRCRRHRWRRCAGASVRGSATRRYDGSGGRAGLVADGGRASPPTPAAELDAVFGGPEDAIVGIVALDAASGIRSLLRRLTTLTRGPPLDIWRSHGGMITICGTWPAPPFCAWGSPRTSRRRRRGLQSEPATPWARWERGSAYRQLTWPAPGSRFWMSCGWSSVTTAASAADAGRFVPLSPRREFGRFVEQRELGRLVETRAGVRETDRAVVADAYGNGDPVVVVTDRVNRRLSVRRLYAVAG